MSSLPPAASAASPSPPFSLGRVAFLGLLAIALYVVVFPLPCDDHWWHIATGRMVLETGHVPQSDPFSFTMAGAPWVNWEWAAGVLLALAWGVAGPLGMVGLRFLALGGALAVALRHRSVRGTATSPFPLLVASLLALVVVQARTADRPHTLAFPLLALTDLGVGRLWEGDRRWGVGLLAIFLLWVNLHPSWLLGAGLVAVRLGDAALSELRSGRGWARARRALPWVLGLALTPLVTPNVSRFLFAVREIFAQRVSPEWGSFFEYLAPGQWPLFAFAALVLLWLPAALRERTLTTLFVAVVAFLAFRHVRFAPLFALLALPRLATPGSAGWLRRHRHGVTLLLLALGLALAQRVMSGLGNGWGVGVDPRRNPVAPAELMAEAGLGGRVYCTTKEAHGYLIFRLDGAVRVYIDGRVPQVYPPAMLERYLRTGDPSFLSAEIDRWEIDHVVMTRGLGTPQNRSAAELLRTRGDFALLYFDENGALWSRRSAIPAGCASCRPFEILDPWRLEGRSPESVVAAAGRERVARELEQLHELAPDSAATRLFEERFGALVAAGE